MKKHSLSNINPNQNSSWCQGDNEDAFNEHWADPAKRQKLIDNGHNRHNISYITDSHGLRNNNEISTGSAIAFGCSFTFGIGLPEQDTWPTMLSNKIGTRVYNAGVPGSSSDTVFRLASALIPAIKPKAVFILLPFADRHEMHDGHNNKIFNFGAWMIDQPKFSAYAKYHTDTELNNLNQKKNLYAMQMLCSKYDVSIHYILADNLFGPTDPRFGGGAGVARDLMHPGRNKQAIVATEMTRLYNNQLTCAPIDVII